VKALIHTASHRRALDVLEAVERPTTPEARAGGQGRAALRRDLPARFALWGLAFKPNTDDMREAPSRVMSGRAVGARRAGAAYDPVAMDEARRIFGERAA
jgi:UDPglucose 6-dehydrogenase